MKCINCNQKLKKTDQVCPYCGADFVPKANPPKRSKAWVIALAMILALLAAIGIWKRDVVADLTARAFLSPEAYYHRVEKHSVRRAAEQMRQNGQKETVGKEFWNEHGLAGALTVSMNQEALGGRAAADTDATIFDWMENAAGIDLSWLKNFSLRASGGLKDELAQVRLAAAINDTDITNATLVLDCESGMTYLTAPDVSDATVKMKYEDLTGEPWSEPNLGVNAGTMPTNADVALLIERYAELCIEELTDVSKGTETVHAGNKTAKYLTLDITIDNKTALNIAEKVLKTMREDEDLARLIKAVLQTTYSSQDEIEEAYTAFVEELDSALEEVQNTDPGLMDKTVLMRLYVDHGGTIMGRRLQVLRNNETVVSMQYMVAVDGMNFGFCAELRTDESNGPADVSIQGDGRVNVVTKSLSGKFDVAVRNDDKAFELGTIQFSAEQSKKSAAFTLDLTPSEALLSMWLGTENDLTPAQENAVRKMSLKYSGTATDDAADTAVALCVDGKEALSASLSISTIKTEEITLPDAALNLADWSNTVDINRVLELATKLHDAGMPASLLENFFN